VGECLLRGRN